MLTPLGQTGAPDAADGKAVDPPAGERIEGTSTTSGERFAEKLGGTAAPTSAQAAGASAGTGASGPVAPAGSLVSPEISSELAAGRLSPRAAVDRVVEQVLSRQLGPDAPAAVRDQVRAALQEALQNDPLLTDKLRRMGVATSET